MTFLTLWADYRRRAAERDAVRRLSRLSDDLLRDMGLTRGNVREMVRAGRISGDLSR